MIEEKEKKEKGGEEKEELEEEEQERELAYPPAGIQCCHTRMSILLDSSLSPSILDAFINDYWVVGWMDGRRRVGSWEGRKDVWANEWKQIRLEETERAIPEA